MKKSKSILEETLNDIKEIKHSIEENATFVLKDSLKEDLSAIIKENIDMSILLNFIFFSFSRKRKNSIKVSL